MKFTKVFPLRIKEHLRTHVASVLPTCDARSEGGSIFRQKKVWIFRAVVFFKEGVVF